MELELDNSEVAADLQGRLLNLPCTHTCIYIYIYTCVQTQTDSSTYKYGYTQTNVCIHTYIRTYIHTYLHTYIHTYICVCTSMCVVCGGVCRHKTFSVYICVNGYVIVRVYLFILTYIHTYLHTSIHMHTHNCMISAVCPSLSNIRQSSPLLSFHSCIHLRQNGPTRHCPNRALPVEHPSHSPMKSPMKCRLASEAQTEPMQRHGLKVGSSRCRQTRARRAAELRYKCKRASPFTVTPWTLLSLSSSTKPEKAESLALKS